MTDVSFPIKRLPHGWELVPFEECCTRVADNRDPSECKGKRYLGLEHLASGFPSLVGVGDGAEIASAKTAFRTDDILFGKLRPYLRKGLRVDFDGVCSTDILAFRIRTKTRPDFLGYLIHAEPFAQQAIKTTSGVNHPRTSWDGLRRFHVPRPPESEQRQIALVLSAVQRAIERQERLIALTAELKKALMHKLFTEGTRGEPQKQTEVGPVPESWTIGPLEATGEVIYGIQAAVANNTRPIGTKILTNKNLTLDGEFDLEKQSYFELKTERHRRTTLKKGDILFNWRSGSKEHVGKTAYFDLDGEWTHSSFILRIRASQRVNGRFLFHYLSWLRESKFFVKLHNYAVNAKFNKSAMNALPVVLPDRPEQDSIASAIDEAIRKRNVHRALRASVTVHSFSVTTCWE